MVPEQEKVAVIKAFLAVSLVLFLILLVVLFQNTLTKDNEVTFRTGQNTSNIATEEILADQVEVESVQIDSETAPLAEPAKSIDEANTTSPEAVPPVNTTADKPSRKKIMTLHENFGLKYQDESKTALVSDDYEPRSWNDPCVEMHPVKSGGMIRVYETTDESISERLKDPEAYADFRVGMGPGEIVPGRPVAYSRKMYIDGHPFSLRYDQPGDNCGVVYHYQAYKDDAQLSIFVYIPYEWGFDANRSIDELVTVN